jgi:Tfp pilus assembly protein PilO
MIICRRPLTIYAVDALGATFVVGLMALSYWFIWRPWQETWQGYRECTVQRGLAGQELKGELLNLERFEERLAGLEEVVLAQSARIPRSDALAGLLREMTETAAEAQVEILSVTPQPAVREGEYVVCDINVAGRSRSHDFVRFLDCMAARNPYQSLRDCAVRRSTGTADGLCDMNWTMRVYMLPVAGPDDGGAAP